MPNQIPKSTDLFAVPLIDGSYCLGQVLDVNPILMNSFTCAFFDVRGSLEELNNNQHPLTHERLISRQFVTREQFNRGTWPRIGRASIQLRRRDLPYKGFLWFKRPIQPTVIGSGNIDKFLSAYYELRPWNEMHDPDYYNDLLANPDQRRRTVPRTELPSP